jgi:hypothetical protein
MNDMDEVQQRINEQMAKPRPLVSDDEIRAAENILNGLCAAAGNDTPIPTIFIRLMLEEAAKVRAGALSFTNGERG